MRPFAAVAIAVIALSGIAVAIAPPAFAGALPNGTPLPGDATRRSLDRSFEAPGSANRWRGLPRFGGELFGGDDAAFAPSGEGPVGPDYVLGPGDQLLVFVSGRDDSTYALTLDRDGQVFIPRVGSTSLWGLSFAAAERLVAARLATLLRNARVQVSMGRMRAIDVFVLGDVRVPGRRTLSGLATAFHALVAAGGPTLRGSLRDVRVLRANREIARFDLYPFLRGGDRAADVLLQSGDVLFVGPAGPQVGIQGEVARPGVYEASGAISLRQLLALAGGATPFADLGRIQIERVDPNGGFRLEDLPLDHGHGINPDSLRLWNQDLVTVLPLNERVSNAVTLDGYVRHPGAYELKPGMRVSDLLGSGRLLPEAALDRAEFRRVHPSTFAVEVRSFAPLDVFAGRADWSLQPLDAVTIFSNARVPRSVTIDGQVELPGVYTLMPGERLSDLLARAGGVTSSGSLQAAVLTRPRAARTAQEVEQDFERRQRLEIARQQVSNLHGGDSTAAGALAAAEFQRVAAINRAAHLGRIALDFDDRGQWIGTPRDPLLEDGDHLHVPERPATVTVIGSVRSPGILLARERATTRQYVRLCGGAARDADLSRSWVLRASGEAVPYRAGLRVNPGDAVVIAPRAPERSGLLRALGSGTRWFAEIGAAAALIIGVSR